MHWDAESSQSPGYQRSPCCQPGLRYYILDNFLVYITAVRTCLMINSKQILKIPPWVQKSYLHFMPEKVQHSEIISQEACDSPLRKSPPPSAWIFHWNSWTASRQLNLKMVMFGIMLCIAFYMFYSPIPVRAADSNLFTCLNPKISFKRKFTRKGKMWLKKQEDCLTDQDLCSQLSCYQETGEMWTLLTLPVIFSSHLDPQPLPEWARSHIYYIGTQQSSELMIMRNSFPYH